MKQMDYKEKDKQKANSMAISLVKSLDDYIKGDGCKVKKAIEKGLLVMAEYKNKEFEDLINGLPTPIKELIKAFNDENRQTAVGESKE